MKKTKCRCDAEAKKLQESADYWSKAISEAMRLRNRDIQKLLKVHGKHFKHEALLDSTLQ